jgi:hypothetical protein
LFKINNPDCCNWASFKSTTSYFNLTTWARMMYLRSHLIVSCLRRTLPNFTCSSPPAFRIAIWPLFIELLP